MPTPLLTEHQVVTDTSVVPFDGRADYLYIEEDNGSIKHAYAINPDAALSLPHLLAAAYPPTEYHPITVCPQNGGPNYAAIISGDSPPQSVVVWTSCDFYFDFEED